MESSISLTSARAAAKQFVQCTKCGRTNAAEARFCDWCGTKVSYCYFLNTFYSTAALLAMQSAVIPTAIPSVRPSVRLSHAGTISRRMNIGSRGLHCEVAKTL